MLLVAVSWYDLRVLKLRFVEEELQRLRALTHEHGILQVASLGERDYDCVRGWGQAQIELKIGSRCHRGGKTRHHQQKAGRWNYLAGLRFDEGKGNDEGLLLGLKNPPFHLRRLVLGKGSPILQIHFCRLFFGVALTYHQMSHLR